MIARGVQEFHAWARGELEDMLFQAKNDRLLFAFFNIPLRARRQSQAVSLRSMITLKSRIRKIMDEGNDTDSNKLILLRDPSDGRYPEVGPDTRWMLCEFHNTDEPYGITVLEREHLAWIRGSQWDTIESCDTSRVKRLKALAESEDRFILVPVDEHMTREEHNAREFWREYVPREERARLKIRSLVPYDRIIEIDSMGDVYNPVPHVFVDWHPEHGPFDSDSWPCFSDENDTHILQMSATAESRVSLFFHAYPRFSLSAAGWL